MEAYKRSSDIRRTKLGDKHEALGDSWYNMGVNYKNLDKPFKSIKYLEKAYDIKKELKGENSLPCALVKTKDLIIKQTIKLIRF